MIHSPNFFHGGRHLGKYARDTLRGFHVISWNFARNFRGSCWPNGHLRGISRNFARNVMAERTLRPMVTSLDVTARLPRMQFRWGLVQGLRHRGGRGGCVPPFLRVRGIIPPIFRKIVGQIRWVFGFWYGLPSEEILASLPPGPRPPHFHRRGGAPGLVPSAAPTICKPQ